MILIKTKYKIFIASLLQLPIVFFLKILKKPSQLFINRNGINWFADLNEGIDFSIFLTGKFEHENSNFFKKTICKNDIVFDIGANIGAHTLPIANYVGECGMVHAFEPTKYAYEKQKKNISLNPKISNRIKLNQIMLIDNNNNEQVSALYSSWPLNFSKQEHKKHLGNLRSTEGCKSLTLDQYILDNKIINVKLVKIDVDGFEIEVLNGGKNFFKNQKPKLLIELAPYTFEERGKKFSSLINLIKEINYELFTIKGLKKLPTDYKLIEKIIPKGGSINVIGKYVKNVN